MSALELWGSAAMAQLGDSGVMEKGMEWMAVFLEHPYIAAFWMYMALRMAADFVAACVFLKGMLKGMCCARSREPLGAAVELKIDAIHICRKRTVAHLNRHCGALKHADQVDTSRVCKFCIEWSVRKQKEYAKTVHKTLILQGDQLQTMKTSR
jgi:hypothetical protein